MNPYELKRALKELADSPEGQALAQSGEPGPLKAMGIMKDFDRVVNSSPGLQGMLANTSKPVDLDAFFDKFRQVAKEIGNDGQFTHINPIALADAFQEKVAVKAPEVAKIDKDDFLKQLKETGDFSEEYLEAAQEAIGNKQMLTEEDLQHVASKLDTKFPYQSGYESYPSGADTDTFKSEAKLAVEKAQRNLNAGIRPDGVKPDVKPARVEAAAVIPPTAPYSPPVYTSTSPATSLRPSFDLDPDRTLPMGANPPLAPAFTSVAHPSVSSLNPPNVGIEIAKPVIEEAPGFLKGLGSFFKGIGKHAGALGGVLLGTAAAGVSLVSGSSVSEAATTAVETAVPYGETGVQLANGDNGAAAQSATIETVSNLAATGTAVLTIAVGGGAATALALPVGAAIVAGYVANEAINGGLTGIQATAMQAQLVANNIEAGNLPETMKVKGEEKPTLEALRDPDVAKQFYRMAERTGDRGTLDFLGDFNRLEAVRASEPAGSAPTAIASASPASPAPLRQAQATPPAMRPGMG
jgi:hypothetical protein